MADDLLDDMLPLAEVVHGLRAEILKAAQAGASEKVRFQVGSIDLEFQVVAKREGGPTGTIKFGILSLGLGVEAGASLKFASERTQKVKFTLKPVQVGDDGTRSDVEISRTRKREE